ncbi:MAG: prepilin-type N-terminal cleavage/methylation domain-containing protein [Nitrospirales bacterium]
MLPCSRGFTLSELLMVLGIMGVALVLGGAWLTSQLPNWRLNGAVRQVVSDLLASKMKAVVERDRQRVLFQDDHRYTGSGSFFKTITGMCYWMTIIITGSPILVNIWKIAIFRRTIVM